MIDESRLYSIPILCRKPLCDVCEWAETRHYLKQTSQLYSYEPTPFFRDPCHYMSDLSGTSCVVIKTPAQSGKSLSIMNFLGWMAEFYPSNTLLVLDSKTQGLKLSQNRIRPFLREICGINNPNNTRNKSPDKSNSVANIGLRSGANLYIASAKSASDSKSTPARFVLLDEVDAYPNDINGEGDPVTLFTQRLKRFRGMAVMTSTPTTAEGAITANWKLGTAQTWGVVCVCGQWMPVKYDDIDFTGTVPTIHCPHCGVVYSEDDVKELHHCYNKPTNNDPLKDDFGRIRRSYEITAPLCHSFVSWESLKRQEIAALSLGENSYKSFRNTVLGECYTPKEEIQVEVPELMRLSQASYTHDCLPFDIAFIVCGVDTHDKCLYCETVGFSEDLKRMYGLRYDVLVGDPDEKEVWQQFYDIFNAVYTREDGKLMRSAFAFVDSGGHRTNSVYAQHYRNRRIMPVKGMVSNSKNAADPLVGKQQKLKMNGGLKGRCTVQFVGVNAGKDELSNAELLTIAGDKRLNYLKGYGYNPEYFKGLLSEKKIDGKWIAPQKGHTHNEPLDCRVYAMACASYYLNKYYLTGLDSEEVEMAKKSKKQEEIKDTEKPVEHVEEEVKKPVSDKHESKDERSEKVKKFPHW